jgi:hypothetical protein
VNVLLGINRGGLTLWIIQTNELFFMKKLCLLLTLVAYIPTLRAQTFPYYFSVNQGTYTALTNAVSVNEGQVWDDPYIYIPIGFSFTFFGETIENLYLSTDLSTNGFGAPPPPQTSPLIIAYGADLIDRGFLQNTSQSPISYLTEGAVGSRIFKLEYSNAGFFNDSNNNDFVNTQLWLYEGSNDVEIHFGTVHTSPADDLFDGFTGPIIGFIDQYSYQNDNFENLWYLSGTPANPEVKFADVNGLDTIQYTLFNAPENGRIYRFSTAPVGVKIPVSDHSVQVFPSLVHDVCSIKITSELAANDLKYKVLDQFGKTVGSGSLANEVETINTAGLGSGMYYVHVSADGANIAVKKIVKQ